MSSRRASRCDTQTAVLPSLLATCPVRALGDALLISEQPQDTDHTGR